ncbi:MAG: four helix bundle protein [Prochloraceae cyanobacterium]|nr:four helix bundle protein [Prochloraceae cyanobacterium]
MNNHINLQTALEINDFFPFKKKQFTIKAHKELRVYQMAFDTSIRFIQLSKKICLKNKSYSVIERIRHSSRLVCTYFADACQQSHNLSKYITKLNDCYVEVKRTQTWINFAVQCGYLDVKIGRQLEAVYNQIKEGLIKMFKESQNQSHTNLESYLT